MFYALSVFNQAYPARLRSQFTGFPNISSTNALFCHETGAPAFEESPCGGRPRSDGFHGTRVSSDRQLVLGLRRRPGGVSLPSTPPVRSGLFDYSGLSLRIASRQ